MEFSIEVREGGSPTRHGGGCSAYYQVSIFRAQGLGSENCILRDIFDEVQLNRGTLEI